MRKIARPTSEGFEKGICMDMLVNVFYTGEKVLKTKELRLPSGRSRAGNARKETSQQPIFVRNANASNINANSRTEETLIVAIYVNDGRAGRPTRIEYKRDIVIDKLCGWPEKRKTRSNI